ncbi:small-subunit processome [Auriculariales sp. MPI-PUGE-AT-0066]|nr:small-subunit processome [Auriculariales sp. MPI-PUGE-AT-0066]
MAGGSLRNSLHRRNHKERGQLAHRKRLGHLEKHKDYVLRARDYHSKQDRLKRLRVKAADKNEDEFYFGMVNQRTKGGVHIQDRGTQAMPVDMVKILKSQDGNYIRTMRRAGAKKIDKLKLELGSIVELGAAVSKNEDDWEDEDLSTSERRALVEAGLLNDKSPSKKRKRSSTGAKHTVFADDQEHALHLASASRVSTSQIAEPSEGSTEREELGWVVDKKLKRKRTAEVVDMEVDEPELTERNPKKHRTELLKELAGRLSRDKSLRYAERELEMQRLLMGKGTSRKLKGLEKVTSSDDEDLDDLDTPRNRKGKKQAKDSNRGTKDSLWKPREYKWKYERKR